jgi:16S rRNA (cytidine1402-2'-O)-methyltransferase
MSGVLNIVTTPIGDYSDMTLRALRTLTECDYVVCEEYKEAAKLLRFFDLKKELRSVNEHNEKEESDEIFMDIAQGKNIALISDCGTPLFSDPGSILLQMYRSKYKNGIYQRCKFSTCISCFIRI